MSALTLTLREAPRFRVDCSPLVPDRLAGLSAADIAAIELARAIGRMPERLLLIGIEAAQSDWASLPSAPVDAAIDAVVGTIVAAVTAF